MFRSDAGEPQWVESHVPGPRFGFSMLSQVFPILIVAAQHGLVGEAVKEVVWDSNSGRLRVSFNEAALMRYSEQLSNFPHKVVISVCRSQQ
jgi:hypothetical protein